MTVSDREIDRAMQYGLEDFDWLQVVVEIAFILPWTEQPSRPVLPATRRDEEE